MVRNAAAKEGREKRQEGYKERVGDYWDTLGQNEVHFRQSSAMSKNARYSMARKDEAGNQAAENIKRFSAKKNHHSRWNDESGRC